MAYTATTPTSTCSFGNVSRTGDAREGLAREVEACSRWIVQAGSTAATAGAQNIGYDDGGGFTTATNVADSLDVLFGDRGVIPASGSTRIAPAGGTKTLKVVSGCLRTISTVAIATGMTIAISATGATQGQRFRICKIATGGTGAVTVDGHAFTTHKKFNCELVFCNGLWRMTGYYEYA